MQAETRQKRWRLILGGGEADGIGCTLSSMEQGMDQCLAAVYDDGANTGGRRGSLGASAPNVTRWLGDIRQYFPATAGG